MLMRILKILYLHLLIFIPSILYAIDNLGEYNITITIQNIDKTKNEVLIDFELALTLPAGNEHTFISLPIPDNSNFSYNIEPISNHNNILFGHLRPDLAYGIFQISLLNSPSKIYITLKNILFQLKESTKTESGKALNLLFNRAIEELKKSYPLCKYAGISKIIINTKNFQGSEPQAALSNELKAYVINSPNNSLTSSPIILYLGSEENQYFLYIFLAVLGLFIGLLSAQNVISSKKSSIIWFIISTTLLVATIIITFFVLPRDKILTDTTTIVTIGTIIGILLGLFGSSIFKMLKT